MQLKILIPFQIFVEASDVKRIVAITTDGSVGILPRRLDCVAALVPGIFTFETESNGEQYVALDEGVLVKSGTKVLVSSRDAIGGADLGTLREAVEREFRCVDDKEKAARSVLAKLESGFVRRFVEFHHDGA